MQDYRNRININYIAERDIDFLVLQEFFSNRDFSRLFMDRLGITEFEILEVAHSVLDISLGETDMMVVFEHQYKRACLLIENKIDALAMPEQYNRYYARATKLLEQKMYDSFYIFIIAPESYLMSNQEAKKYPYQISYEEIHAFFTQRDNLRYHFQAHLIQNAISKKKMGYQPIEHISVTKFWESYYKYTEDFFPHLKLNRIEGPRGVKAVWPWFDTNHPQVKIAHKSDKGFVDLTFFGIKEQYFHFREQTLEYLDQEMKILLTGKSIAVRIVVPIIDFKEDFNSSNVEIHQALEAVDKLNKLSDKIDVVFLHAVRNK